MQTYYKQCLATCVEQAYKLQRELRTAEFMGYDTTVLRSLLEANSADLAEYERLFKESRRKTN